MIKVRVRLRAREDIENAARWYESQRVGLGGEYLDEVRYSFQRIAENPSLYPIVHRETHRALLQKFPFGVFYQIRENCAVVFAVMHSSRDPNRWKGRT